MSNTAEDRKKKCPARDKNCDNCGKQGHLKSMCQTKTQANTQKTPKQGGAMTQEPKKKWSEEDKRQWYDLEPPQDSHMGAMTVEKPQTYAEVAKGEEERVQWIDMCGLEIIRDEPILRETWPDADQWENPEQFLDMEEERMDHHEEEEKEWQNTRKRRQKRANKKSSEPLLAVKQPGHTRAKQAKRKEQELDTDFPALGASPQERGKSVGKFKPMRRNKKNPENSSQKAPPREEEQAGKENRTGACKTCQGPPHLETRSTDDTSTHAATPTVKQSPISKIPRQEEKHADRGGNDSTPKAKAQEPPTHSTIAMDRSLKPLEGKEDNMEEINNFLKQEMKIWRQRDNRARPPVVRMKTTHRGSCSACFHSTGEPTLTETISERGNTPPKNAWKKAVKSHINGLLEEERTAAKMMTQAASLLQKKRGKEHKNWIKAIHKTYQKRCRTIRQHEDDLKAGEANTAHSSLRLTASSNPGESLTGNTAYKTPFHEANGKGRQKRKGGRTDHQPQNQETGGLSQQEFNEKMKEFMDLNEDLDVYYSDCKLRQPSKNEKRMQELYRAKLYSKEAIKWRKTRKQCKHPLKQYVKESWVAVENGYELMLEVVTEHVPCEIHALKGMKRAIFVEQKEQSSLMQILKIEANVTNRIERSKEACSMSVESGASLLEAAAGHPQFRHAARADPPNSVTQPARTPSIQG